MKLLRSTHRRVQGNRTVLLRLSGEVGWTLRKVLRNLLGKIPTVLSRAQAPTRRMFVDQKGLGKSREFSGKEVDFYNVWAKKVENHVSGVFPNVSQDVVTAGVTELDAETSTETHGQFFTVLSALTDGESFDVVTSAGGDGGFESWRELHPEVGPTRRDEVSSERFCGHHERRCLS